MPDTIEKLVAVNLDEINAMPLNNFVRPDKPSDCTWHAKVQEDAALMKTNPHSVRPFIKEKQKIIPNILHAIGSTPMVKLNRIPQSMGIECDMYVKCEFLSPGGSVKDRIGYRMVQDAEDKGLLKPGYTIIEPTSGELMRQRFYLVLKMYKLFLLLLRQYWHWISHGFCCKGVSLHYCHAVENV